MEHIYLLLGGLVFILVGFLIIKYNRFLLEKYLKIQEIENSDKFTITGIGLMCIIMGLWIVLASIYNIVFPEI